MHSRFRTASALLLIGAALSCGRGSTPFVRAPLETAPAPVVIPDSAPTFVEMKNVQFHVGDDVVMYIHTLSGTMRGRGGVVDFDDATSFITWVSYANVSLTAADLETLFNHHVFAYRGAPLRNIKVQFRGAQLIQSGILHKGVDIPFKMVADVSVTADGRIRLHPVDTDIFCVDGDKLMSALGLTMQKMVDVSKAVGVAIEKNDFLIDPIHVLPPPAIRGRLVAARVENGVLVQEIRSEPGSTEQAMNLTPPDTSGNYMYYRGGRLKFGRKLLMTDADMQVVDGDPATPFDFNLMRYMAQLTAGYSRTLETAGLYVVMPDANRVHRLEMTAGGEVVSRRDTTRCNCPPK